MAFFKKYLGTLIEVTDSFKGDGYEISASLHTEYTYPFNDWYWFDNIELAKEFFFTKSVSMVTLESAKKYIQKILDDEAATKGYGDEKTAPSVAIVSYVDDLNLRFATEAKDFKDWRSKVWSAAYSYLSEIESGHIAMPENFEKLKELVPKIVWTVTAPSNIT